MNRQRAIWPAQGETKKRANEKPLANERRNFDLETGCQQQAVAGPMGQRVEVI
jgi:hypothetical protein